MKKLLLLLLLFTTFITNSQKNYSVNYQFDADIKVHTIESLCGLNNGNNPFDKEDFQSNFDKTPTTFTKGNSNFLSKTEENGLIMRYELGVHTNLESKYQKVYDTNGNIILLSNFTRNNADNQPFVPSNKTEITNDDNGNSILHIYYIFNTESQSFVPNRKEEITRNTNGAATLNLYYDWNTENQSFIPIFKDEITYDDNGSFTLYVGYIWNTDSQSFVPSEKTEVTYDTNENQILRLTYYWDTENQSFVPSVKYEYTYDTNGNRILRLTYYWDTENQSFVPLVKYEYTYDTNGNIILFFERRWNTETQSFVTDISVVSERNYDTDGNITWHRMTYNSWDTDTQSFIQYLQRERTYDTNGNLILDLEYSDDYGNSKKEYTFDYDRIIPLTKVIYYDWFPNLGVFKPNSKKEYTIITDSDTDYAVMGTIFQYETNFNQWTEVVGGEFKSFENYTKIASLSVEGLNETLFSIYPNPTNNALFISGNETPITVSIYNLLGKEVLSIKNTNNINVEALPSGVYVIRISDSVGQTNRKFIKN